MPVQQTRFARRALEIALACVAVSLGLVLLPARFEGPLAWTQIGLLGAALTLTALALRRQRALQQSLVERDRVEDELRVSEGTFSGILDIAADAIITIDEHQRILHFNEGAATIFGWPQSDAIGQPLDSLLPERFRATHDQHVHAFGRSAETSRRMGHRRAVAGLRRDGTEFPAEASISKLDLPNGRRIYTVVLRDITEQTRAAEDERFLAEVGARFAQSLDYDGVLDVILEAAVPRLAPAAVLDVVEASDDFRRVARGESEVMRRFAHHPLTWDSPSPVVDVLRRGRTEHVEQVDESWLESHEEDAGALTLWRDLGARSLLIVPLSTGERTSAALTLVDLGSRAFSTDERRLAETFCQHAALALENARLYRAARDATRARDEVLGVVSHDLRNPISAIAMCARALREEPDAATREEMLAAIDSAIDWMQRLIQDLLDVSAIEAGRLSVERAPGALAPIVSSAVDLVRGDAAERSLHLDVRLGDALPSVQVDAERIVQVLANLLGNAVKFTEPGGRIAVYAVRDGGSVIVAVQDTGVGIPEDDQPLVFERYWHARRSSPRRGSGLGLAISKGIIEAHGGRIWVESASPGGSTFRFTLPIASPPLPASMGAGSPAEDALPGQRGAIRST